MMMMMMMMILKNTLYPSDNDVGSTERSRPLDVVC